jgi:hypothetical protein
MDLSNSRSPLPCVKPPKLLYPKFPVAFSKKLPNGISIENLAEHCVCWNCMPGLWDELANHITRFHPLIDRDDHFEWAYEALRHCCDIRAVMKFVITQLDTLSLDTLSALQQDALSSLETEKQMLSRTVAGEQHWNGIPRLADIANPLDTLFFQDCISGTSTYSWVTHDDNGNPASKCFGYYSPYAYVDRLDRISVLPLGHPDLSAGIQSLVVPQERVDHIIGTILHEQVHALLTYYPCNGNCKHATATEAQRKLCAYLHARTVSLFCKVEYNGMKEVMNCYHGHGSAFQVLCRQLRTVATKVLRLDKPLHIGSIVTTCKCKRPQPCLSHCCVDYFHMQQRCELELVLRN